GPMTMQTLSEDLSDAHTAMTEYWDSKRNGSRLPLRRDLNPCELRRYLSHISIIELVEGDCSVRLSGTVAKRQFGLRQKARISSDLRLIESNWWLQTAKATVEQGMPCHGIRQASDGLHAWLRLPLLDCVTGTPIVMCHDSLMPFATDNEPTRSRRLAQPIAA
ncbi:MAG: PAS domain-containing protein, partial [Pseudomonadota bacterium]